MSGNKYQWNDLATYNAEVAHGVVHTPEKDAEMAEQQRAFNEWIANDPYPPNPPPWWLRLRWWLGL